MSPTTYFCQVSNLTFHLSMYDINFYIADFQEPFSQFNFFSVVPTFVSKIGYKTLQMSNLDGIFILQIEKKAINKNILTFKIADPLYFSGQSFHLVPRHLTLDKLEKSKCRFIYKLCKKSYMSFHLVPRSLKFDYSERSKCRFQIFNVLYLENDSRSHI